SSNESSRGGANKITRPWPRRPNLGERLRLYLGERLRLYLRERLRLYLCERLRLCLCERLRWGARAGEIAVAVGLIDPRDRRPVLVLGLAPREQARAQVICVIPVHDVVGRVGCIGQRVIVSLCSSI